uniref:Uncharacterized protein n=1 Tax=Oryza nivara TaxID=4536 RepID=A0A0E0G4J3_ORYNI
MSGLPSIDGRLRVTARGGEVGPALHRRSTPPQPTAPSASSLRRSITVPTSKANQLRVPRAATDPGLLNPASRRSYLRTRKIQADRIPCQLLLFAAQSRKFLADSTKFLFGIGMASMYDVDFSPHQATLKESMNFKDDAKVQPSSGQTPNKGNYYVGHANAIIMMFQYIRDGCRHFHGRLSKKVEEGRGEKRKVGEAYDPRWSSPIEIIMKICNDDVSDEATEKEL